MAEILREAQEIDMLVIGCCSRKVFEAMRVRLRESGMDGRCRITHIICMDARQAVSNISAIRPMLYHPGYMAYCVEHGILSEERECLYRNNWIMARYRDGGAQRSRVFLLVEKGVFCSIEQSNANTYPMLNRIFAEDMKKMLPLKMNFASSAVTDYLAYIRECLKLEAGRAIYMIKLDVPLSCVHPDILLPMARAGFADMAQEDELESLMAQMESVHRQRWDNLFAKRKPTHMIFSREAMEHFARTGRQSDHLHILDAYAPQARVQILENLRRQTMDNPNFSVHFFRQDFESPLTEVGLYEGAGVLLTKPYTHYDLSGDHAESIIREKEFCEQYKRFYTQDLLERCVLDGQETIRVLDELIEAARRQEAV